ncbi:hypothetical protein Tco_1050689 [Tanacetum coccineum]
MYDGCNSEIRFGPSSLLFTTISLMGRPSPKSLMIIAATSETVVALYCQVIFLSLCRRRWKSIVLCVLHQSLAILNAFATELYSSNIWIKLRTIYSSTGLAVSLSIKAHVRFLASLVIIVEQTSHLSLRTTLLHGSYGIDVKAGQYYVTAALIDVNAAQSKLVLLENFNENYSKCLRLLYKVNAAEGVNAASEEVSTVELVSTAYVIYMSYLCKRYV